MKEFVELYNQTNASEIDAIPADFFNDVSTLRGSNLIEKLARYGNPTIFEMPTPLAGDLSCDMSFTGLQTYV